MGYVYEATLVQRNSDLGQRADTARPAWRIVASATRFTLRPALWVEGG